MRKKKGAQEISNEVLCAEYEAVYHYALSICRNETEAQDLTQETFLKAMNAVESFKGNSSVGLSIILDTIINKFDRRKPFEGTHRTVVCST